jgi:hypothetical protein
MMHTLEGFHVNLCLNIRLGKVLKQFIKIEQRLFAKTETFCENINFLQKAKTFAEKNLDKTPDI